MQPLIRLCNVTQRYGAACILDNVSLEIAKGDIILVHGPSGAGKSTLLRLIGLLERPDKGQVISGAARLGYVFQEPRLLPWKTVRDNLILPLDALGCSRTEATERAHRYLTQVELNGFDRHYPGQLSGGMLQRVALARALSVKPDLLLLDEAFSALDRPLRRRMERLVAGEVAEACMTVVLVSHTPEESVIPANRGVLVSCRTVDETR